MLTGRGSFWAETKNGVPPLAQLQAMVISRYQVMVRWSVTEDVGANYDLNNYNFTLLRSTDSTQAFEEVTGAVQGITEILDAPPYIGERWQRIYYKVRVTDRSNPSKTYDFGPASIHEGYGPSLEALYMIEQMNLLLANRPVGHLAYAYIKQSWGPRCNCWNYVAERSDDDNCLSCAGTGWAYPHSELPVRFHLALNAAVEKQQQADFKDHMDDRSVWTTNYPDFKSGDIIHIPSQNNTFYIVDGKQSISSVRGYCVRQAMRLHALDRDHPAYEKYALDPTEAGVYMDLIWNATEESHFGNATFNPTPGVNRESELSGPGGGYDHFNKPWTNKL